MTDDVELPQYRTRLSLPRFETMDPRDVDGTRDNFYDIIEAVAWHTVPGSRDTVRRPRDGMIFVWFEAEDLYALANVVRDLEDELNSSVGGEHIMLDRPERVERKSRI